MNTPLNTQRTIRTDIQAMAWLALLSLLFAIQGTVVVSLILATKTPPAVLSSIVVPEWQYLLRPEWEMIIYRFFAASGMVAMAALVWRWRNDLTDEVRLAKLKNFICVEFVLVFLLLSAMFKMTVYADRPDCARIAVYVVLVILAMHKCVRGHHRAFGLAGFGAIHNAAANAHARWVAGVLMFALVAIVLYIPNPIAVVARNFVGEQFHHNDSFIMGPGLAWTSGRVLDVDTISQYGIGFVAIISSVARVLGSFDYLNVLIAMMTLTIVYYWSWAWLLRRVFGSVTLALAAILLGIKWQMFHSSAYPLVFTYGSLTPVRFLYDVLYFVLLWQFLKCGRAAWLWAVSAAAGFGIFYFTSEGLYATASLYAFVIMIFIFPSLRRQYPMNATSRIACFFIPPTVFLALMSCTVGGQILHAPFWQNMGEFIQYFMGGFGLQPMYKSIVERNFLQALMGFVIPIVYAATLLALGTRVYLQQASKRDVFIVVLCLYGLGTFHYYVARSVVTSYDTVALPFAFTLIYWAQQAFQYFSVERARLMRIALVVLTAYALLTNHLFMSYPNILNWSANPMTDPKTAMPLEGGKPYFMHLFRNYPDQFKLQTNSLGQSDEQVVQERDFSSDAQLIDYYKHESNFTADADLISRLTAGDEPVPLVSSFEIPILMAAHRAPYFYYFPLVISRPMHMRMYTAISIYTMDQMQKTLNALEADKPEYIFMERIFLNLSVPQQYLFEYPTLLILLNYIHGHYAPAETGQYLVAMKRK